MAIIEVGHEPEKIKKRLSTLFEKLDGVYPDKVITRLHQDHKRLGEGVTSLYRELGYPDGNSFLEAYGYKVEKPTAGRPKSDHMTVIEELRRRYPSGPTCSKMAQLIEENPDLASKFKNLANQSNQLFGMSFAQFLILNGILIGETPTDREEEFQKLKDRYRGHPFVGQMKDLRTENKDIKWSVVEWAFSRQDSAKTMKSFLIKEGILSEEEKPQALQLLKDRYKNAPLIGGLKELKEANPDIRWSEVEKECRQEGKGKTLSEFLVAEGVLFERAAKSRKEILTDYTRSLQDQYKGKPVPESLEQILTDNPDIPFAFLTKLAHDIHSLSLEDFLVWKGLLRDSQAREKLAQLMSILKPRYFDIPERKKPASISELQEANPDVDLKSITSMTKAAFGITGTAFLTQEGLLLDWNRVDEDDRQRKEAERLRREEELAAPVETWNYTPGKYYVEEVSVSEDKANDWVFNEKTIDGSNELFLVDYQGDNDHIILPISIAGKKVAGIDSGPFLFKKCKAETVEIPGAFERIPASMFFSNDCIKRVVIGEGIKEIGNDAFFSAKNLESVEASQSIEMIHGSMAFHSTKWFEAQEDYAFVGRVLLNYSGDSAVLNVPEGIKTVAQVVTHSDVLKVVLSSTVETLCESAFSGRGSQNIKEFVYSPSLKKIGRASFGVNKWIDSFDDRPIIVNGILYQWKTSTSSLVIPDGVTSICDSAFKDREELKKITFPETLKEIGDSAFSGCSGLIDVELPKGLLLIGRAAFKSCGKLSRISVGDSLVSIGQEAFNSCYEIKSITLPPTVRSIGASAFRNCSLLSSITLPESIQEIGDGVFARCPWLDNVVIPSGITSIGAEFFSGCSRLKNLTIPRSVKCIGPRAFEGCELVESVAIPVDLAAAAFSGCKSLVEVRLAKGIKSIPQEAFKGCESLQTVEIPASVAEIAHNAYLNCTNLQTISLPVSLKKIGLNAFQNCKALEAIVIPAAVESIMDRAFMDCSTLKTVVFEGTVNHLGIDVFTNTPYLKSTFGEFAIIGGVLTKYLGSETDLTIPDTVTAIAENAFAEARFIKSLHIPDSVQEIGNWLFGKPSYRNKDQIALTSVELGNGVVEIGDSSFQAAEKLTKFVFGRNLKRIGKQAFTDCKALKQIDLRETSVESIGSYAFSSCYDLTLLLLPDTLKIIEESAFNSTGLRVATLPKSTVRVGRGAFSGIKELYVYDTIEPDAAYANEWSPDQGSYNRDSRIPLAMFDQYGGEYLFERYGRQGCHITVLSAETEEIRYRVFIDSEENDAYKRLLSSAWGKFASFRFGDYDDYFMKTRSLQGRAEMAFCRIQYPEGLSAENKAIYDAYFERCMYIERSARRIADLIAKEDNVERLEILFGYHAIDEHNLAWVNEVFTEKKAARCLGFLSDHFSKQGG